MRKLAVLLLFASALTSFAIAQDKKFLGRWDLTVTGDKEYPSWLELSEKDGKLTAQFTGRWGNARPLPKAEMKDGTLTFVSPKEEEDATADMVYEGTLKGDMLSGTVNAPKGGQWTWIAKRAPKLDAQKNPKWGKPIDLFNGKDLTGWTMSDPKATNPWKVIDGALTSPEHGPEIISNQKFKDFKIHVEFNIHGTANSGVYLRGRYEAQIETDSANEGPEHHTGSIYGFLVGDPKPPRQSDVWQTYDITLLGRWVTVVLNGKTIIDHKEIPGLTGGALDSNEADPGPIYLQGSEVGHVAYRKVTVTPAE
ncbi:protein of unknown function DUF1080 [Candidatus Koribacter versatilis Ellin345]|uniref:3-keto-alpha-glucoside-1,2-lyase/3-keto-2-hydroxy-glucal hydratase domain-containing protein n=1 Tax=Koribacter versatilis (strain Ellin345) TaxID=204669 RepID=Q1IP75_KORVE|nr:DUF1080 domain-containing protein [Candidatus Koribacter versatilis]ABF41325.1 protein of unknown function DUF1080 [Candidatus Koribacter versatilis Ellin345]